jgi:hypothetical protein
MYRIFVGKSEKRKLEMAIGVKGDNIKVNLNELDREVWIGVIWLWIRTSSWLFVKKAMKNWVP